MALVIKDRVKVLATTTGTGTFTLGAGVTGFQDFSVIGDGNTTYYTIAAQATPDWEVGIGTYTASGTLLSRDTILESSNGGAAVDFPAGTKDVFVTYPAERATYLDVAGAYPVQNTFNTLNAANAVLTAGTVSTTPVNATDLVNKTYVDTAVSSGIHFHQPVRVESPINLNATYNNGTSGVGATLTNAGTQVALVVDGVAMSVADRVLVYEQTTQTQNGIYVVTDVGSGSTNWILTRSSDADTYAFASATALGEGSAVFVQEGATGAGETYVCNTVGTITFGTTNITFSQISSAQIYSAGTGLTLTGTQFSITNTGTAGTYGNASNVPVFTTNAQGQVTSVTNTAIAIAAGAVSGLAASATTDTTNASNITSGTLGTSRLSGSYTGITGVGTLAAGTWNGSTIGAIYGGTGFSSFATGDIIYADSSTTLARLADVAVGNALISGGAASDPSWGKIGLTTHVDGILPVANGGTGNATNQAASVANNATFNNSGAGAASGSTFNGSSPLTISYNTLGAYPTTNPAGYTNNTGTVTSVGGTGTVNGLTLTGTVATSGNLTLGGTLSGIANSALTNSSVTVNGTSIALGASGTVTANTTSALTFNNGGAGAASGSTFSGGTPLTISYNTVGAPSVTGTGASGTWGINVTGNAATATALQTARTINGVSFNGTANITVADSTKLPLTGGTMSGTLTYTLLNGNTANTRDKIRLWTTSEYTIGMNTSYTYGGLGSDYAMSFQMNSSNTRGFWWGDSAHTNAQGAMALTTNGLLTVASGMRLGYGESDTTTPTANLLEVNGNVNATTFVGSLSGNATTSSSTTNTLTRGTYLTGNNFNGSAATTWAVDATTTATGSKIVARDVNGNDFRVYGYAQYFNMSHGVSGATGDTVFYSSTDDFIRKNNAAGFRTSLNVPTRTGGDASGTWGISISGNAATVTNGVYQNQYGSFQVSFTSNINANTNRNAGVYGSYASAATNTPTTSGLLWNATAGADGSGDGAQIWQDYATNNLYARQRWGGSYGSWLTILSASNYNSYAPTLTGGGASGTWGINVTGNAATATTLIGDQTNWASYRGSAVANMLSWKNYGNGHVIFDASQSTSPTGSAVNNTNSTSPWTATYPTLMGWNGGQTYGVRVDSARVADSATTATTATNLSGGTVAATTITATTITASNGIVVNSATIGTSYTIPTGSNAMSAGPIEIDTGIVVTVSSGSTWTVV
jgi:hypothetical protein